MKIKSDSINPSKKKTSLLCTFILENSSQSLGLGKINPRINLAIKQSIKETEGKIGKLNWHQKLSGIFQFHL